MNGGLGVVGVGLAGEWWSRLLYGLGRVVNLGL